jgi:hypothetical protein
MSRVSNYKLVLNDLADDPVAEFPIIESECSSTDRNANKRKEDAKKPLYIRRV